VRIGRAGSLTEKSSADSGFTLLELMCALAIFGVLSAISVGGLRQWTQAHEQAGTAAGIQSVLRETQQRAVTEGRSMCVNFNVAAQTYAIYRGACNDLAPAPVLVAGPLHTASPRVRIAAASFTGPAGTTTGVTFKARGTAWPGSVQVLRDGSSAVHTVSVEGLTGRVSLV
jgi:prepilin-type N-terminal cleavage/methylation domain-containing protein